MVYNNKDQLMLTVQVKNMCHLVTLVFMTEQESFEYSFLLETT